MAVLVVPLFASCREAAEHDTPTQPSMSAPLATVQPPIAPRPPPAPFVPPAPPIFPDPPAPSKAPTPSPATKADVDGIYQESEGVRSSAMSEANATHAREGQRYVEPTLIGRIVDGGTKQPIKGAFVYGHYATSSGSLGGGRIFGEHVKSFSVATDENGVFKLDGWDTKNKLVKGERSGKFPSLSIYKPGFELYIVGLNSITQWYPNYSASGAKATVTGSTIDWSQFAHELTPVKTEVARYGALSASGRSMMMVGECGWETYAGLLLARHNETKAFFFSRYSP